MLNYLYSKSIRFSNLSIRWNRLLLIYLQNILLILIPLSSAFNLDTDIPIVKGGIGNSYFGFSVAQHQIHTRQRDKIDYVMLVGAPLSSYFGDKAENPGAIYKCPLTSITDDCVRVKVEDDLPSDKDENRNNQWLGVTIKSHRNGDSVVTCGHRYSRSGSDYHWGFGICYSLSSVLDYEEVYSPCVGRPVFKAHQQFGYCQAGTSVYLAPNDDLVIGAPGSYTWTGALFKTNIASGIFADRRWFFSPLEPPDIVPVPHYSYLGMSSYVGQFYGQTYSYVSGAPRSNGTGQIIIFMASNKTSSTNLEPQVVLSGTELGSGFGYEVIGMDLNADGYQDLIVGAPFHYDPNDETVGGAVFIYMNGPKGLSDDPILLFGKNESLFGYAISSAGDLNQDGYDDLAIGAPNEMNGLGAVYVYHGSKNGLVTSEPTQKIYPTQLKIPTRASPFVVPVHGGSSSSSNSYYGSDFERQTLSFGHSLSGGIDMDQNGYPDLLIGAYQSDRIFLLRSRPIVNIFIDIRDLPNAIDPQNPSASPCPSADDNAKNFVDQDSVNTNNLMCFPIKVCLRFEAHPVSTFTTSIVVRYTLNAERFNKKPFSRVNFFQRPNTRGSLESDKNYITTNILRLAPQASNQYVCDQHMAYLKPETKDFLRPILFQLSVNLTSQVPEQYTDEPIVDINTYPILNQKMSNHLFQVKFLKDCGLNDICESDMHLEAAYKLPTSTSNNSVLTLGQNKEISVQIFLENFHEPAYETELYLHFPETINYIGFKMPSSLSSTTPYNDKSKNYLCSLWNATLIKCEIGNPFKPDEKVELTFNFDVTPLKLEDNNVTMFVNVTTTSTILNTYPKNVTLTALIIIKSEISLAGVSFPEQIFYGGIPHGESHMKKGADVGSLIEHRYVVVNHGPGTIGASDVTVYWPYEVENNKSHGKWLLYMVRHPWVDGNGLCEIDSERVNMLKLDVRFSESFPTQNKSRQKSKKKLTQIPNTIVDRAKRRSTIIYQKLVKRFRRELVILPESKLLGGKVKNVVTMDCYKGSAKCFTFTCHIGELAPSESIVIHILARIWNSTLVEDYPTVDAVTILSRAKLIIDDKYNVEQNVSNDEGYIETIAYPDLDVVMEHKESEPWIIIVAICSGIFLFFLLTIVLWKMGFFKRKQIKPPHTARLEKPYNGISDL